jgi:membrane protein DedA with SNARE-associated domain
VLSQRRAEESFTGHMGSFLEGFVHHTIEFIKVHQEWAFPVVFLVLFGESFVGIGVLFPGTTILVLSGILVSWPFNPHGALSLWPVLTGAISGAVIGDGISYWLGRRFGHLLDKHWYFVRHPELLPRGFGFFEKYGGASLFVARFFGPLRAVITLVGGIMTMTPGRFWFANIASACIWAPALLLFGASIHELSRYAGTPHGMRLIVSGAIVVAVMIVVWAFERFGIWARLRGVAPKG